MSVHQCAHSWNNLRLLNECAVKIIAKYLASVSTYVHLPDGNIQSTLRGVVYKPDIEKDIGCYVDVIFSGGWAEADADNLEHVMSHTWYVIIYAEWTLLWGSKLQTETNLSSTAEEYISLNQ